MSEQVTQRAEFDGYTLPTSDEVAIVRCVHEGVCPTCGGDAAEVRRWSVKIRNGEYDSDGFPVFAELPAWDTRKATTVQCGDGHKASVEPSLSDWTGWIGS